MSTPIQVNTSWLRSNPADLLGHHRPETFDELLTGRPQWVRIYQEWLDDPSNATRALSGMGADAVVQVFRRLADPSKARGPADDLVIQEFEQNYKSTFYQDIGVLKDQIHAQVDRLKRAGVKEREAISRVGGDLAREAVKAKVKGAAGASDVPAVLQSWAQVQSFKQEFYAKLNEAMEGFVDRNWGKDVEQPQAMQVLADAVGEIHTAEANLRNVVLLIQNRAGAPTSPVPKQLEDELFDALIAWATAINGVAVALGKAAELVVEWAQRNAREIANGDFDSVFPILGGALFAARVAVGTAGIVLSFFPTLSPIATGLSLADNIIEFAVKKITVEVTARNPDYMVKFAGKEYQLPEDYYESAIGSAYKLKEDAKQKLEDMKNAVKGKVVEGARFVKDKAQETFPALQDPQLNKRFEQLLTELNKRVYGKEKTVAQEQAEEDAEKIKEILGQIAELLEIPLESVSDVMQDYLVDLFKEAAPGLANAVSKAMPFINIVIFVVETANDALNFHAAIHKKLENKEGLTDADVARLESTVMAALKDKNLVPQALNFDSVKWIGPDGERYKVEVAGIVGSFDPHTMRFSPDDNSAIVAVVVAAAKKERPDGHIVHQDETYRFDWANFQLGGDGSGGIYTANVAARKILGKGGAKWKEGDDGREYQLKLNVDSSGGSWVTALTVLGGDGAVDERATRDPAKKLTHQPAGKIVQLGGEFSFGEMKAQHKMSLFAPKQ